MQHASAKRRGCSPARAHRRCFACCELPQWLRPQCCKLLFDVELVSDIVVRYVTDQGGDSVFLPYVLHRGGLLEAAAVCATPRFGPADNEPRFSYVFILCVAAPGQGVLWSNQFLLNAHA